MVRASHDDVVSALRAGRRGVVSPTSASGWTAAWVPDRAALRALGDQFAIEDGEEQELTVHVAIGHRTGTWTWNVDDADGRATVLDEAAEALGECLGADRAVEVREILEDAQCSDALIEGLAEFHDLPSPWGPLPRREVTLQRGDPAAARLAARIVAGQVGSTGLARLTDGWSLIRVEAGPDGQNVMTMAVAAGGSNRRTTVLELWRGDDAAAGFALVNRTGVIAEGRWNTGWRDLEADGWEARDAAAEALARHARDAEVDGMALRTLLRARSWHDDPLAELVALLDLPHDALRILDGAAQAPELRPMKPAQFWRLLWEEAKDRDAGPWITARWLRITLAVYAVVVSLVALGAAAVKYAVVATDGAVLDHDEAATSDWVFAIIFTLAVPLNLWCAVQLIRRGTFF